MPPKSKISRRIDPVLKSAIDIVSPRLAGRLLPAGASIIPVPRRAHRLLHQAVKQLALCFRQETGFAFSGYNTGRGVTDDVTAYLWPHPQTRAHLGDDGYRIPIVGGVCFRQRNDRWTLIWIWLHPYYRRQGLLRGAWPAFRRKFGDFKVAEPLSAAMTAFLADRRECARCGTICQCLPNPSRTEDACPQQ